MLYNFAMDKREILNAVKKQYHCVSNDEVLNEVAEFMLEFSSVCWAFIELYRRHFGDDRAVELLSKYDEDALDLMLDELEE